MATSVQFYHLLHTTLAEALVKLMEKALAQNARVLVLTDGESSAKKLSDALWTSAPESCLAHGTAANPTHADMQPIYITWREENPNNATILVITDGSSPAMVSQFSKVLDIFDGRDAALVARARERWSAHKEAGYSLQYIKQQPSGGWKIEA